LDYFNLGTVDAGQTILLSTRKLGTSQLDPVVAIYDAAGGYVVEKGGRPFDGVAQVEITKAGTYYALMRGGNGTGGILDQYILDVQIVRSFDFPNLEVTDIVLPTGSSLQSGQPVTFSWTVKNVGNKNTQVTAWSDRV